MYADKEYILSLRHEIHEYPEIGFDLPKTISLVKTTSIVGFIAVQDLTKVGDIIRSRTFDAFFPLIMVAILYFVLSWIFATALDFIGPKKK